MADIDPGGQEETIQSIAKKELPVDAKAKTKRTAPKFPSPSECSKWLMLYWLAGFSVEKIRWLLSQHFKLDAHKAYNVKNIESTFRLLQRNANRNNPDYYSEPYMYYLMTSKSSSPFEFRQSATRWLERHHPEKADEMTADDEIHEMAAWYERWTEEVRLMQGSKVSAYLRRAEVFEKELDYYAAHFDAKGHVAYLEEKEHHSSNSKSSERPSASVVSTGEVRQWGDNIPVTPIERPRLRVRTKLEQIFRGRSKQEGTQTPSSAQTLDELGFFARRPRRPSPGSIIEPKTRTPSLSSTESSIPSRGSQVSLPGASEAERRPLDA